MKNNFKVYIGGKSNKIAIPGYLKINPFYYLGGRTAKDNLFLLKFLPKTVVLLLKVKKKTHTKMYWATQETVDKMTHFHTTTTCQMQVCIAPLVNHYELLPPKYIGVQSSKVL